MFNPRLKSRFDYLANPNPSATDADRAFSARLMDNVLSFVEPDDSDFGTLNIPGVGSFPISPGDTHYHAQSPDDRDRSTGSHGGQGTRDNYNGSASGSSSSANNEQDGGFLGFLSNLFGSSGPLGGIGNLLSSLAARLTGASLTGAEREQNAFNSQEAAINRNFQSAETEKARQWQEDQYLRYNSPSALVRQYQDAGINPALIAGGNMPAASTSTAAPSGAQASGSGNGSPIDFISGIISLLKSKAEINNINADTEQKKSAANLNSVNAAGQSLANGILEKFGEAEAEAKIRHLNKSIESLDSQMSLNNSTEALQAATAALQFAQAKNLSLDATIKEWTNKFIEDWGVSPELAGQLMRSLSDLVGSGLGHLLDGFFKNRKVIGTKTVTQTRGPKGVTTSETTSIPFPIPKR